MKKFEVKQMYDFISGIRINKLEKELRNKLVLNFIKLEKIVKDIESEIESIRKKCTEGLEEELQIYQTYKESYNTSNDDSEKKDILNKMSKECKDAMKSEADLFILVNTLYGQDISVELNKIEQESFIEALSNAEVDFTFADLSKIKNLFE